MYYPLKDKTDIFRLGVAISDSPAGPFIPQPDPIRGSYSIDPAIFEDTDGTHYMYFGGLWGGQLQRYKDNKALESAYLPSGDELALPSRVVRLSDDMLGFAEEPRPVTILNQDGTPMKAGQEPTVSSKPPGCISIKGKYYFSYSTGDTHLLCYAIGDNPYGAIYLSGCDSDSCRWLDNTSRHC